jgi:hypothetical protein
MKEQHINLESTGALAEEEAVHAFSYEPESVILDVLENLLNLF